MNKLIFINIALLFFSASTLADTIKVGNINDIYVADTFVGSSSITDFEQSFYPSIPLTDTALQTIVSSDYRTSVKSPVTSNAYIDLAFTNSMFGGSGNDLVLFFVGNNRSFGLDVFEKQSPGDIGTANTINTGTYSISTSDTVFNDDGTWKCFNGTGDQCTDGFALSAIFIDFGENYDGVEIGNLHLTFGEGFNNIAGSANFALAGGFHNTAVVPLPLPIILFSSGLAMLGWFGRRRTT